MPPKSNETLDYALKEMQQQRMEDRELAKEDRLINREEHKQIFEMQGIMQKDNKATRDMIGTFITTVKDNYVEKKEFDKFKNNVNSKTTIKKALVTGVWSAVVASITALGFYLTK